MKSIVKSILNRALTWLLVLSMGMFIANKAMYFHSHKLADGRVVTHAHPFDKSDDAAPFKTHHHSKAELFFFCHIDTLIASAFLAYAIIHISTKSDSRVFLPEHYTPALILNQKSRAPPSA